MQRADAWKEGYNAYKSGLSYFDNPHVHPVRGQFGAKLELSVAWSAGWKSAYQMNKGT